MEILIVGGAGYIGSFMNRLLIEQGYNTTVLDNLSTGHRSAIRKKGDFIEGDLADYGLLMKLFASRKFDVVMHFAAFALVGESVKNPLSYYHNNVANTINLLKAMKESGIKFFIFSSTAAVYGNPQDIPIIESHPVQPVNPYGWSKAIVEQILKDSTEAYDIRFASLRYFNAAGAHPDGSMGEDHQNETHLIPLIIKSILDDKCVGKPLHIFGTDYDTSDGTCIRDYIHVLDLVQAHMLAMKYLLDGGESDIFNLGNGKGFSVLEVIKTTEKVISKLVPVKRTERRAGDPPVLIAGSEKISQKLGWKPNYMELETIIESAWKWHSSYPKGYNNK